MIIEQKKHIDRFRTIYFGFLSKVSGFLLFAIFGLLFIYSPAAGADTKEESDSEPVAQELRERFKSESFSLGILLQTQTRYSFEDTDFNGGRAWDLGSTRIDFRGTVDRDFTYRVRVYFLSQQQSIDARVGYRFSDNHQVVAGAYKPFLSKELDPSPANLDFVRRARLVGAMMNTLEIGVSTLGNIGSFWYSFGMYNGSGVADVSAIAESNDNRFLYTGRLAWEIVSLDEHTLELGGNGAYNGSRDEDVGNTELISQGGRTLYGGYLSYDSDLIFGTIEFIRSQFDAAEFAGRLETIDGAYATLGVNLDPRNELLVRWDYLGFDIKGDESNRFLLGWNYCPTSLVSFRVNALADFSDQKGTQFGLESLFQYHF